VTSLAEQSTAVLGLCKTPGDQLLKEVTVWPCGFQKQIDVVWRHRSGVLNEDKGPKYFLLCVRIVDMRSRE